MQQSPQSPWYAHIDWRAVLVVCLFGGVVLAWLIWTVPLYVEITIGVFVVMAAVRGAIGVTAAWRKAHPDYLKKIQEIEHTRATVQIAPLAHTVSMHTIASERPALQAPDIIDQIDVIKPMSEWMAWIDEQPHTLLGGKTKAGKTWLATALLERRIDSGSDLFIIDPHSSDWLGLPTAGGGGRDERRDALKAVLDEYLRRMAVREAHKRQTGRELPHDYFDPLCVLIDESNALLEELAAEWKTVLKQVASGSRKVGISLLMLAQSPLVEDLGISGAMRENFSRIALDERTVQTLIDSERDRGRKQALQVAFRTMDRPAAAQIGATVWLLDRRGLSPGNASAGARIWAGWDFDLKSVSPCNAGATPLSDQPQIDNEVAERVIRPGAGVAPVARVALSVPEIVQISTLLTKMQPSEVAKSLDGYNARNYREMKQKVDVVMSMLEGKQ